MKIQQKLVVALTMLLMMAGGFPALDVKADDFSEEVNYPAEIETTPNTALSSDLSPAQDSAAAEEEKAGLSDTEAPAPMFSAYIEYTTQGYIVMGSFEVFSSDISFAQPLYSLDGENWYICGCKWDLSWGDTEGEAALEKWHTQSWLFVNNEPFSSYLAGELDCFYLKLCLTMEDGSTYETQAAIIERGAPQPLPQDFSAIARFDRSVLVKQMRSYSYGRYQLTINADATAEDIAALLPDTLPIEIQFMRDDNFVAGGIVDCPVIWKPLTLPQLTAGDSVTIQDAAEEIVIPAGTLVSTPMSIFQLNEPLSFDQPSNTDEVRLVLNVVAEDENPTGVLRSNRGGLEMAFDLKPTGATAIHAYTFSDDAAGWVELSGLSLLEAVNSHSSAANSGYALVVRDDSELLQHYWAEMAAGEEPTPFYVGLKIEGGVYDGRQLVLAWPGTYHEIPSLPNVPGAGGNEGNAGTDNKGDSTEGGQRPNLPKDSEEVSGGQPQQSQDSEEVSGGQPQQSQDSEEVPEGQQGQSQDSAELPEGQPQELTENPGGLSEQSQDFAEADTTEKTEEERLNLEQSLVPGDESGGQRQDLQQKSGGRPVEPPQEQQVRTDTGMEEIRQTAFLAPGEKTNFQISEKTDSNTQISTTISSHSLFGTILLTMVIAISCICLAIVTGRGMASRKS